MYPRSCVAAVIICDGCLLVVKKRDAKGIVYSFPTGGQEAGETLVQAVQREALEEVGCEIVVGPLLWVREYIGKHHENADLEGNVHVVCHLFHCTLNEFPETFQGKAPDPDQEGVEWLPLQQLASCRFYPQALVSSLMELERVQEGCSSGATPLGILPDRFRGISQPPDHQTNHRQTHHTFAAAC
ncbi:MAG TPA: NUDIX domain-containing protein, partial [Ktedonobacteraceae bacterium]|nr:NUDIX domain-containing protein [Ktedonobacteraceae bacterium]